MKSSVVITLIVVGGVLILAPLFFEFLLNMRVADVVAQYAASGTNYNFHLNADLAPGVVIICMLAGIASLWTGIAQARKLGTAPEPLLSRTVV